VKTQLQLDRAGTYSVPRRGALRHCGGARRGRGRALEGAHALRRAPHALVRASAGRQRVAAVLAPGPATGAFSMAALLASGLGAGVAEALLVVIPFEVVMTRLQQQRGRLGPGTLPLTLRYRGPIHCARRRPRGRPRGLWAGAVATVLRNGANQAAMFTCKSRLDAALWGNRDGDGRALRVSRSMASGFIAAAVGPLCTGPFDVVKSRLMAQGGGNSGGARYRGTAHALRMIYAEEGVRALCKGLLPKLVRIPAYLHSSRRRIFDPLV
jgi:solute carrier family 25 (mitochondrial citrate transporter), member 1